MSFHRSFSSIMTLLLRYGYRIYILRRDIYTLLKLKAAEEKARLKQEEAILDKLFDQTKYRAGIEKLAEELANHFIQNLNQKGLDNSVKELVSDIRQPNVVGRGR